MALPGFLKKRNKGGKGGKREFDYLALPKATRDLTSDEINRKRPLQTVFGGVPKVQKSLDNHVRLAVDLDARIRKQSIPGFKRYTSLDVPPGVEVYFNTPGAARQIVFAMAMSAHELVRLMSRDFSITPLNFSPSKLRKERILKGMRILDLGCGKKPVFARCVRALGAEVITIDLCPATDFQYARPHDETKPLPKRRQTERNSHLRADLKRPDIAEMIDRKYGKFDLVTVSDDLPRPGGIPGWQIAMALAPTTFYNADTGEVILFFEGEVPPLKARIRYTDEEI